MKEKREEKGRKEEKKGRKERKRRRKWDQYLMMDLKRMNGIEQGT